MRYVSPIRDLADKVRLMAKEHPTWSQVYHPFQTLDSHLQMMARLEEINQNKELKDR